MDEARLVEVLEGLSGMDQRLSTELSALRAAITVEDSLGIVIPEEFLDADHLASVGAVERLIRELAAS